MVGPEHEPSALHRALDAQPLLRNHPLAMRASLVLWVIGGSLFVALAIPRLADIVQRVDDRVWEWAVDLESGFFVGIAKVMDFVGSSWVTAPVMIGVAILLIWWRRWEGLFFWCVTMVLSQLLIGPMKALYERPRPPLPLVATSHYSFPSGHAVAGAAVAVGLVIVLIPASTRRLNLEVLAALFAFLMASSRVYLRAHWLSDVVAGAALGAALPIAVAVLVHRFDERRERRRQVE